MAWAERRGGAVRSRGAFGANQSSGLLNRLLNRRLAGRKSGLGGGMSTQAEWSPGRVKWR
jgi:hypothetical protein